MPIQITSRPLVMNITTQDAMIKQSGNAKQSLELDINAPELQMKTKLPKVKIDQTQPFAEAGIKNNEMFLADNVSFAIQKYNEGVSRIVSQGNEFINIHNGYDPIPDQAVQNAYDIFVNEFNYAAVPRSRPNITLDEGNVDVILKRGNVSNQTRNEKVNLDYVPYTIEFAVQQYNEVKFSYQEPSLNFMV